MLKLLSLIIGIGLGAWGMYKYYPKIHPVKHSEQIEKKDALVKEIDGVYIFIECEPRSDYKSIGHISQDNALETIDQLSDISQDENKNVVEKLLDGANEIRENISFDKRLNAYVKTAKMKHPDAEGLLFQKAGLEEATIITFQ